MGQSDGSAWEKSTVEWTGGRGCVVPPLGWERGEEGVEIIGRVIAEENLEFKFSRIQALERALLFDWVYEVLHGEESVGPHWAAEIDYADWCGGQGQSVEVVYDCLFDHALCETVSLFLQIFS